MKFFAFAFSFAGSDFGRYSTYTFVEITFTIPTPFSLLNDIKVIRRSKLANERCTGANTEENISALAAAELQRRPAESENYIVHIKAPIVQQAGSSRRLGTAKAETPCAVLAA